MPILLSLYHSPVGPLLLGSEGDALCLCDWDDAFLPRLGESRWGEDEKLCAAKQQLDEYFTTRRTEFDLPLRFYGTDFQRAVWQALLQIPYATTISYQALATAIGKPRAVRAVANAVSLNPISIFVPCHRVIGSDGTLTGYAGGLDAKRFLLDLERRKAGTCTSEP